MARNDDVIYSRYYGKRIGSDLSLWDNLETWITVNEIYKIIRFLQYLPS